MRQNKGADRILLEHIRDCIKRVQTFANISIQEQADLDPALLDRLIEDAVVRNLQVLSESTQRLSDTIKNTETDIPWRKIRDFRNILTHDYLRIEAEIISSVVEKDLPDLAAAIERMITKLETDNQPGSDDSQPAQWY